MAGGDFFSGFDAFTLTISLPVPPAPDVIGAAAGPPPSAAARSLLSARREAAATRVGVSWRSTPPDWYRRTMHICVCACGRSSWAGQVFASLCRYPGRRLPHISARAARPLLRCVLCGASITRVPVFFLPSYLAGAGIAPGSLGPPRWEGRGCLGWVLAGCRGGRVRMGRGWECCVRCGGSVTRSPIGSRYDPRICTTSLLVSVLALPPPLRLQRPRSSTQRLRMPHPRMCV